LRYFRDEYEAHIKDRRCPAKSCKALISHYIDPDKCLACMICLRACPSEGIDGGKHLIHFINQDKCSNCGTCLEVCPPKFDAIVKFSGEPVPDRIPEEKRVLVRKGKNK
jgi:NADH-quinone oxidoreductase subunit F